MTTITHSPKFLRQRQALLLLPLLCAPFLIGLFFAFGGGKGTNKDDRKFVAGMGLNLELPKPIFDPKENNMTKMDYYRKADQDSLRRKAYWKQDPYRQQLSDSTVSVTGVTSVANTTASVAATHTSGLLGLNGSASSDDVRTEELLKKLEGLKKVLNTRSHSLTAAPKPVLPIVSSASIFEDRLRSLHQPVDTADRDPQLDRLNQMLDKIIQIQHPARDSVPPVPIAPPVANNLPPDTVKAAAIKAPASSTIPAVVDGKQKLVAGATIALRLTDSALINGVRMDRDQLIYGVVSFHNDRMAVHISSVRIDLSIYPVSLDVYDMDGLAGIHIPHLSGRQVARESADQGIGSVNLASYDPSLSGQVANAGIQVARSLFRHKVSQEKVKVKNGYPVLLKAK